MFILPALATADQGFGSHRACKAGSIRGKACSGAFYLNAACTKREGSVDEDFLRRTLECLATFRSGAKAMLLAFDFNYDEHGVRREDLSAFHVANRYAAQTAGRFTERLEWICSIHPYRTDAIDELGWCVENGARAVKWLPSAMGMDPASPRCDRFMRLWRDIVCRCSPMVAKNKRSTAVTFMI